MKGEDESTRAEEWDMRLLTAFRATVYWMEASQKQGNLYISPGLDDVAL